MCLSITCKHWGNFLSHCNWFLLIMTKTEKKTSLDQFFDISALGNRLWLPVAHFWVKKLDRTGPVNTRHYCLASCISHYNARFTVVIDE